MKKQEKTAVSVYEYRSRRCNEIFTDIFEEQFSFLVCEMENLSYLTDPEGERERAAALIIYYHCPNIGMKVNP